MHIIINFVLICFHYYSEHDKAYKRWMPHINMLYPFVPDALDGQIFEDAAKIIQQVCKEIEPFRVVFSKESFGYFKHRKNATMWLKPVDPQVLSTGQKCESDKAIATSQNKRNSASKKQLPSHEQVLTLQAKLEAAFPGFTDLSTRSELGFQPHLSLGQFKPKTLDSTIISFQEPWADIEFTVKEIYLISRANFDDPFHIRHVVKLGSTV